MSITSSDIAKAANAAFKAARAKHQALGFLVSGDVAGGFPVTIGHHRWDLAMSARADQLEYLHLHREWCGLVEAS